MKRECVQGKPSRFEIKFRFMEMKKVHSNMRTTVGSEFEKDDWQDHSQYYHGNLRGPPLCHPPQEIRPY